MSEATVAKLGGASELEELPAMIVRGHHGVVATAGVSPNGESRVRFSPDGRWLGVAAWTPQNPLGDFKTDPSAVRPLLA